MPSEPQSIAIVGAGNIGSGFALFLVRAGHKVCLVARPGSKRLQQLQRDNGIKLKEGPSIPVAFSDALDENEVYDLIVVTVLAHQVDAVLPALKRSKARLVEFMFNVFHPERIKPLMGDKVCCFGMPFILAHVDESGALDAKTHAGKTLHGDQTCVDLFNNAGIPSLLEANITQWLRSHAPFCVAIEGVCYMAEMHNSGATWEESMKAARAAHAGAALITKLGHAIYPSSKRWMYSCPAWMLSSMLWTMTRLSSFRKLLASASSECNAIIQAMQVEAAAASIQPEDFDPILAIMPERNSK
eukprot:766655-Hanusia_phi.AAC.3